MADKKFIDGLIIKSPHQKAPDFVKCSISIKRKDLGNWLRGQSEDWINIDVKEAKSGKWYAEVNDWKPNETIPASQYGLNPKEQHNQAKSNGYQDDGGDFIDDDIPFARPYDEYFG